MNESDRADVTRDQPNGPVLLDEGDLPEISPRIARFRIDKVLGNGGFGFVFLAQDEQLKRLVRHQGAGCQANLETADAEAYPDLIAYAR